MSTSAVTISINLVDNNSAAVLQKTEAGIARVGMAGTAASAQMAGVTAGLNQVGAAGTAAAAQLDAVGANGRKAASDLLVMRGVAAEAGIGLSRFFSRELLDKFPGLVTAIRSVGTAFFALGAIEIGMHMAEGLGHAYEKWLDLNKAERDYYDNISKNAGKEFLNFDSLSIATERMKLLANEIDRLKEKQKEAGQTGGFATAFVEGVDVPGMKKATDELYEAKAKQDQGTIAAVQAQHKWNLTLIEDNEKVGMVGAKGFRAIAVEHESAIKRANEDHDSLVKILAVQNQLIDARNRANPEKPQIPLTPLVGYDQNRNQQVKTADQLAAEKRIELVRNVSDATVTAQHKAIEAGLEGDAKWLASKKYAAEDAARELRRSLQGTGDAEALIAARVAAIHKQFDNEHSLAIKHQLEQSQLLIAEAQAGILTGIPRIQAENAVAMQRIGMAEKTQSGGAVLSPDEQQAFDNQRRAQQIKSDGEIAESKKEYYARLRQMNDEWDTAQLQGYARIEAETFRHLDTLTKAFEKEFPKQDISSDQKSQDTANNAWENSDREREKLHRETLIGLQKEEVDAARALMAPWASAQAQIIGQYNERLQKATHEYDAELAYFKRVETQFPEYGRQINAARLSVEEDYQAKVKAARGLEAAQMQKAAQQMRDELAGKLSSFFQDPMKFMEKQAESVMMKIIANWIMQLGDFQHNPALQIMFGMGKNIPAPGASSHPSGLAKLMGAGGSKMPDTATTQLSYAGSTLGTAGSVLITAAGDLTAAAATMGRGGFGGSGWSGGRTSDSPGFGGSSMSGPGGGSGSGRFDIPLGTAGSVASLGGSSGGATGAGRFDLPLGTSGTASALRLGGADYSAGLAGAGQTLKLGTTLASDFSKYGAAGTTMSGIGPVASGDEYSNLLSNERWGSGAGIKQFSGAVSGGLAMFGALEGGYKKASWIMGGIGGAASGAAIGSAFMPGIGTAVGTAVGAVAGIFSGVFGEAARRKAAREYLLNVVEPKIQGAMQKYYDGNESYDQAQHELSALQASEKGNFGKWGKQGNQIWGTGGLQSFSASAALLLDAEKAGRGDVPRGTSEFHSGGFVAGFGPGDLGNGEGLAKLRRGEYVVDANTTAAYRPALEALTHSSRTLPLRPASSGGEMHLHVHALDLPNFERFLSGGGDQKIVAAMNRYQGIYAGIADQQ